ncbi:uncharacterized protein K452DRAFT_329901 [Aplosporella prunicola CBS 121167]|uniref:Zona occludens toxin N-terminal domain-containing protein n=1 Tax=Aplosporella prunicola CBS 121167 TaxID=1176127 RepID=A0A6A6AYH5_9PEZI|nr:uncharacterized protein K452DRAFT_329901 [Aplosporella prunicola CBS 121167]KAF2136015.1 hypothetical protein K452DRAFT_329901 [Aplosporella prunicola CBS 121167]
MPHDTRFNQYALLGHDRSGREYLKNEDNPGGIEPIFLNINTPWSAFLCGSQGSGKSHTLSCMLEGCLMPDKSLGKLPHPLKGIVFHYDQWSSGAVCEAAHLCSRGIKVNVLVSPSNFWKLNDAYKKLDDPDNHLTVRPLLLQPGHLNVERMLSLMAFNEKDGKVPLYMEVINRILRDMAIASGGAPGFDYTAFKTRLDAERFTGDQKGPMSLRLQLLESFLDFCGTQPTVPVSKKKKKELVAAPAIDIFKPDAGSLTIVDLTDPFVDASSACTLFDICLALFLEDPSPVGRVIALDEAHKYMNGNAGADRFTETLLTCIRIQRHAGCRIIIATQEPTVSPKLLDLCSMTIVHRFTSPAWLTMLETHIAGLSRAAGKEADELTRLFQEIVTLRVGEALLFAPSAMVRVSVGGEIRKLGVECLRFKTRQRLTSDGGMSVLAMR